LWHQGQAVMTGIPVPRKIAPLFAQKIVHTAPLQKQNICNIKQVIFDMLVAFIILFIYVY
jgi:hypothetical protein